MSSANIIPLAVTEAARDSRSESRPRVVTTLLAVSLIFFVLGSAVAEFRWFPYSEWLQPAFTAARAIHRQVATASSLRDTDLWRPERSAASGVAVYDRERCHEGLTLYTSGHDCAAFLIDMEGTLLHQWRVPFHSLWEDPPHLERAVHPSFIHWRRAHLFPNGDLIAIYEAAGDTPWGYGLVKVDRDSNVLWKLADHVHHDVSVRPDGSIVTLVHDWRDADAEPVPTASHLNPVLLDDFVLVLSADGEVLQRISLLDALGNSPFAPLLATVPEGEWDLLHTNTVEPVTAEFARHHPFAEPGQVMLSFRSRQALAILDLDAERIVWATCGPYRAQHDPDVLPNGRILLFDNQGDPGPGGPSRILELDPVAQTISWCYAGSPEQPLFSLVRSTQQQLPNGNVLIAESDGGRILEVCRDGQICWEFFNPARLPGQPPSIAIVCGAARLDPGYVRFPLDHQPEALAVAVEARR